MEQIKVFTMMAGLTALLVVIGGAVGGQSGAMLFLVMAALMNFGMYWFSDKMVLRMYKAKIITETDAPELYRMVDTLRQRAGLPMPTEAIAPSQQPNAFATGRNAQHAVVDEGNNPIALLAMAIVAPIAAMLIQFAISRQNEFVADRTAAEITGKPRGLANALLKLEGYAHRIPMDVNPAAAQLAIINPLSATRGGFSRIFSTHPSTEERVARLEALTA